MSKHTKPKRKRRWFQFSLASLFLLMTLAVGVLVAWRVYVEPYQRQRSTMALIERLGGTYQTTAGPRWLSRLLGYDVQNVVTLRLPDCDEPNGYLDGVSRLPHLDILVVGGPNFDDEQLRRLRRLTTLRWLALDSTSVTEEALAALKATLPNLRIQRTEYRAAKAIEGTFTLQGVKYSDLPLPLRGDELHQWYPERIERMTDLTFALNTHVPFVYLPALTLLENLDLTCAGVDDQSLAYVGRVKSLRKLSLSQTSIGDAGLAQLSELTNLRELHLVDTQVTDAGLVHLHNMPNLEVLDLTNTKVSAAGVESCRRAHPKCKVLRSE